MEGGEVEMETEVEGEHGRIFDVPVAILEVVETVGSRPVGMDELGRAIRRGRAVGLGRSVAYRRRRRRVVGVARVMGGAKLAREARGFLTRHLREYTKRAAAAATAVWRRMAGGMQRVRDEWSRFCGARRRQGPTRDGETRIHGRPPEA